MTSAIHNLRPLRQNIAIMAGFSYVEVLVATFLIGLLLVPATDLLFNSIQGSAVQTEQTQSYYLLTGKMEELLATPRSELHQAAIDAGGPSVVINAYSDVAGSQPRRLVYLARYDGDNADGDDDAFTGAEENLLWLRVEIEGTTLNVETLLWDES